MTLFRSFGRCMRGPAFVHARWHISNYAPHSSLSLKRTVWSHPLSSVARHQLSSLTRHALLNVARHTRSRAVDNPLSSVARHQLSSLTRHALLNVARHTPKRVKGQLNVYRFWNTKMLVVRCRLVDFIYMSRRIWKVYGRILCKNIMDIENVIKLFDEEIFNLKVWSKGLLLLAYFWSFLLLDWLLLF